MVAATPPHAVVVCPPSRHAHDNSRRREGNPVVHRKLRGRGLVVLILAVVAVIITGGVLLGVFLSREFPTGDPVYSVANDGDRPPTTTTLSPAFNLTLHIDNTSRNSRYRACVPGASTAAVSYGDALLANGTVPPVCAEEKSESECVVAARAVGDAVAVPRFLLDQMAGELAVGQVSVDVKVTMPRYAAEGTCRDAVLSCKAKIGVGAGPPVPCRLDYVKTRDDDQSKGKQQDPPPPPVMFFWPWPPYFMYIT